VLVLFQLFKVLVQTKTCHGYFEDTNQAFQAHLALAWSYLVMVLFDFSPILADSVCGHLRGFRRNFSSQS
jgi:hypothetical protein